MTGEYEHAEPLDEQIAKMRSFSRAVEASLVVLCIVVCAALYVLAAEDARDSLEAQASTYADFVLTARLWNSAHQTVYVLKTPQSVSNIYLRDIGVEPDVVTTAGVELTMRNPAAMTREMSELTARSQGARFRLASLKPVNPRNAPDEWERSVLTRFETDKTPASTVKRDGPVEYYHYLVPLIVDETCLRCHEKQGYQAGDVRGGLDVSVPYGPTAAALRRDAWVFSLLAVVSSVGLVTAFGTLFGRYQRRLEDAAARLKHIAAIDELTEIPNRRSALERLRGEIERSRRVGDLLSVIGIDIDHFKQVNDDAGHAAGDAVLREVASRMSETIREYDLVARIGGEEFLVIAPTTGTDEALSLAQRILQATRSKPFSAGTRRFDITLSAGVTTLGREDDVDALLARADRALYLAKEQGRDRAVAE